MEFYVFCSDFVWSEMGDIFNLIVVLESGIFEERKTYQVRRKNEGSQMKKPLLKQYSSKSTRPGFQKQNSVVSNQRKAQSRLKQNKSSHELLSNQKVYKKKVVNAPKPFSGSH